MNTAELKALLQRVREEVESSTSLEPDVKADLAALDQSILKVLQRDAVPEAGADAPSSAAPALVPVPDDQGPSIEDQALALETKIAAEHPVLFQSVRQMIDTLGKMGI
jgi:hypothetical protein